MKLHYYAETDSLYIELSDKASTESREIADCVIADFDAGGNIIGIDIDHASKKLDLTCVETVALPLNQPRIA